jgi:NAD(P)-dependent dehydrogenase (short-subunit alcohol dehydrogenase family)
VQVSSVGGLGAFANQSAYHASKWALEAVSESLAAEVRPLGIKVTIVEPALFSTDWAGSSARWSDKMTEYDYVREMMFARRNSFAAGNPRAAAQALLEIVDSDNPPLRALFGAAATAMITELYQQRLQTWRDWEAVSRRAQGG